MHFHWRTQCAARCLGEIVLKPSAHCDLPDQREVSQLTRRSSLVYLRAADGTDTVQPQVVFVVHRREGLSAMKRDTVSRKLTSVRIERHTKQMKQLSAQTYVPTFVAGDKVLANFDTNQLEKFLTEHQINPQEISS